MFKVAAVRFHVTDQQSMTVCSTPDHAAIRRACSIQISKLINQRSGPIVHHVKLMTPKMTHKLKKTTLSQYRLSLSQKV